MAFDWNDYFGLAQQLSARIDNASLRTAVSRAYYSAFHDALVRAERNCGPKQGGGNSHEWCWNQYIYSREDTCHQLGIDGKRLKAQRHQADYDSDDIPRMADFVARALSDAQKIKLRIAALDPQYPRL